jgi:peptidoglycan-N-acetylglucosamine deacetylase
MTNDSTAILPTLRHWQATPLMRVSLAGHLIALVLVLLRPHWWPWILGAVIADHLLLTGIGLWPRSRALGSNWTRLPQRAAERGEVAISIDDGPDPDITPRVLTILAAHGARATFFCIGERVARFPQLARECLAQGHAVENHSDRHRYVFALMGLRALRNDVQHAQQTIEGACGVAPRFFRAPAGLRNPFLQPLLDDLQLRLASWTRRGFDTVNGNPDVIYNRLAASLKGGDILLLHDANAARGPAELPVILDVLPRLLDTLRGRRLTPVTLRASLEGSRA